MHIITLLFTVFYCYIPKKLILDLFKVIFSRFTMVNHRLSPPFGIFFLKHFFRASWPSKSKLQYNKLAHSILKGGVFKGFGGNWGTLGNPKDSGREDWGTLGNIRGITTRDP